MTAAGPRFRSEVHRGKLAAAVAVAAGDSGLALVQSRPKYVTPVLATAEAPNSTAAKRAVPASFPVPCARFRL